MCVSSSTRAAAGAKTEEFSRSSRDGKARLRIACHDAVHGRWPAPRAAALLPRRPPIAESPDRPIPAASRRPPPRGPGNFGHHPPYFFFDRGRSARRQCPSLRSLSLSLLPTPAAAASTPRGAARRGGIHGRGKRHRAESTYRCQDGARLRNTARARSDVLDLANCRAVPPVCPASGTPPCQSFPTGPPRVEKQASPAGSTIASVCKHFPPTG